ncbi:MAG: glycine cleavage system aminomethyltransferase GcvT, partial [Candidatus Omnitrophica bacterium]|nr:glycine cleavage system aminomethyltransferase GcvT [Candidatus Omnitrophota bacterium]MBD3269276.1 glycine cleavage system aminomethyltransferase GcvT [Candidatus Omnitrophota bacterium]
EDGFEIYTRSQDAVCLWNRLLETGKTFNLTSCGLGARDILRIEAGYPLYGHEIDEDTDPYRAGLAWVVKEKKHFTGKTALMRLEAGRRRYRRIGFIAEGRAFPRKGYLLFKDGKEIGYVTSGTYSPNLEKFIGMGYVDVSGKIESCEIKIRGQFHNALVVKLPFVETRTVNAKSYRLIRD